MYPFSMPQIPEPDARKMQIGEVAKLTAFSVDAIRFYERRHAASQSDSDRGPVQAL